MSESDRWYTMGLTNRQAFLNGYPVDPDDPFSGVGVVFEVSDHFDPEPEEGPAQPAALYRITTVHAGTPTQDEVASR